MIQKANGIMATVILVTILIFFGYFIWEESNEQTIWNIIIKNQNIINDNQTRLNQFGIDQNRAAIRQNEEAIKQNADILKRLDQLEKNTHPPSGK